LKLRSCVLGEKMRSRVTINCMRVFVSERRWTYTQGCHFVHCMSFWVSWYTVSKNGVHIRK